MINRGSQAEALRLAEANPAGMSDPVRWVSMLRRVWILLLLVLPVLPAPPMLDVEFVSIPPGTLEQRLRLATKDQGERFARLKSLFQETGCRDLHEQKVKSSKYPNLICSTAAEDPNAPVILVGAHFDSAGGDGIVDNWTGAILLPSLEEFIRSKPRRHRFEFVGFAAEEDGLVGSRAYLKALTNTEKKSIAGVVTMDSLGLTPTKVWMNSSTPEMVEAGARIARALKLDYSGVNIEAVGTTDSINFFEAKMPVLSLHSVTPETWKLINSKKDVWQSLSWKDYYDTHRLVSALLVYLDLKLP